MDRRQFLRRSATGALATWLGTASSQAWASNSQAWAEASSVPAPPMLPTPNFSVCQVLRCVAGIRPYRRDGVRIEAESVRDARGRTKWLVHNYGHGGAGVTLSWGSALDAVDLVDGIVAPSVAAVVGGGAVGLATASVLLERGYHVTIYARELTPHTTSDIAGAVFGPAYVGGTRRRAMRRMLLRSQLRFAELLGHRYGISLLPYYSTQSKPDKFDPRGVLPPPRRIARLPFAGPRRRGYVQETFLIEPPIYLSRLQQDLRESGVSFVEANFTQPNELLSLPEPIVVNCTGFGARALLGDRSLTPIRGQLVHLRPQRLPYLLSHRGYLFPRQDAVVLGGTAERNCEEAAAQPLDCSRILARNARFFLG